MQWGDLRRQLNRDASEKNDKSFGENLGVTCHAYIMAPVVQL